MKKSKFIFFSILFLTSICQAQKKAITESGDEVILYANGTWKYTSEFDTNDSSFIKIDSQYYYRSKNASFLLKAKNGNVGFWIDPKKWGFGKGETNPDANFELSYKGESIQGVIISESTEIPLESYVEIALRNGRMSAPDLQITKKEYRIVNGLKVLHLEMEGTQVGVKFSYSSYYYSNAISTVQFLAASYSSTMKKVRKDVDELLNGIVEINPDSVLQTKENVSLNKDSTSQGSLSPFNNCKKFFAGRWHYTVNNKTYELDRNFEKTIEYEDNGKYKFEYLNRWIDSCKYELIFIKTNKPNYKDEKVGESMTVEILKIDNKEMRYSILFRGVETKGEMKKH